MKLYTYSAARQRLAEVLEEASREGEVQIRRQDGRIYAVTPVAASVQSPFASVTGGAVSRFTSKELLRLARSFKLRADEFTPLEDEDAGGQEAAREERPVFDVGDFEARVDKLGEGESL